MKSNKNLIARQSFNLAVQNHQNNNLQAAQNYYQKVLKIDPNYVNANYNLGVIYQGLEEYQKAKSCFEKTIEIVPNHVDAHYNLGVISKILNEHQKAKDCYEKTIEIDPNYVNAHNNLGVIFRELGENKKAKSCFEKIIKIDPNYLNAYYNFGITFHKLGENKKAIGFYEKVIEINPNHPDAYWNLHGLSKDIDEALSILKKLYKIDNKYINGKIMISILEAYKENFSKFNDLLATPVSNHRFIRSAKWAFSLPKLPNIFFGRWLLFDATIKLAENSRPFYEFGVWNGVSFKYLINTFKKGFGFDTFSGLPEDWHDEVKGTYSSFGKVPKIEGGEFIVGKFEDTLQDFFSKERPMASLINFDADLYSSTLCALNYSNKVIDEKTILIFDEFIMNDKWEEDEYKALNEFCNNFGYDYEVIAISFFTKQVAVKIKKN